VVRGAWPLARIARSVLHPPYFKRLFNGLLQPIGPHLLRLWLLMPALWICGAEQGALTATSPGPSTREPRRGHGRGCRGGGLRAGAFWRAGPGPAAFGPHALSSAWLRLQRLANTWRGGGVGGAGWRAHRMPRATPIRGQRYAIWVESQHQIRATAREERILLTGGVH
jgi:hypothetical protein